MHIIVTGGSGLTGRFVVRELLASGHEVTSVDLVAPADSQIRYLIADLTDLGQVYGCLEGADAIAHLAAIPRPVFDPPDVVFHTNVVSTFNVFQAAATLGISKLIYASSISVIGYPFYRRYFWPAYAPIDEQHSRQPQDAYALSKHLGEEIALAFVRSHDLTAISLRLAWVHTPESFHETLEPMWDDPKAGASNLWSYVDARDAAQAFRLALESDLDGHQPFFITAANTFMKRPTRELIRQFYPETEIRAAMGGRRSVFSSERARQLLGYRPKYRWEDYYDPVPEA